jgi:hypothetical protein
MTDSAAVEHDPLVQARTGLGVAHARYWLALKRAQNAEGTSRTAALAQARDELEQAMMLRRRIQALRAAQLADTRGKRDQPQSTQRVLQPPSSTAGRHRRHGIVVGRLWGRAC